ncbi:steryl acetyl hydrolase [Kibdelosporangium aridum]|uniref:Steryl acetyl hydrolase n=1 Tax=Kibdelosporangium aridum TaxID=2030 RepID=A0A428ZCJ5_KIBAR|nr:alpha/beta hydrolase fold domain-containing protein [Kibdelosporangium aridum]RSM85802.1 steryl acetyl hydrolase [Kibdelosporangium aridum]
MDGKVLPLTQAPDAIELRHLRAFVAVAEELNFGRAASRLYLSPPALSRQISTLERLVGCTLLIRSTHRVELTLAGQALLDCARKLLQQLDDGITATRSIGGELATRIAKYWAPVADFARIDVHLQDLRDATEALHAQFSPPPEVSVRSVNAGGVPSLLLGPQSPATVLYVHGGAFVTGSAFGYRPLAGALAVAADAGVLVPEFRLAPEHPFPAALEDVLVVYQWMLATGVPASQITVVGDSSGGSVTLSLLNTLKQQQMPMPGGAVLFSPGAIDPTCSTLRDQPGDGKSPPVSVAQLRQFIELYLAGHPADDPLVSPLHADLSGLPPLLVQVGTGDIVVQDAHRLVDHARAHGVDAQLELYPIDTHAFQIFWSFLPEAADALAQAGQFARDIRASAQSAAG